MTDKVTPITKTAPKTEAPAADETTQIFYHMATVLAIYLKGDVQKQRHMNIIFESDGLNVTQAHLAKCQQGGMIRLNTENGVEQGDVKDMVFLAINPLGYMYPEEFHNIQQTAG